MTDDLSVPWPEGGVQHCITALSEFETEPDGDLRLNAARAVSIVLATMDAWEDEAAVKVAEKALAKPSEGIPLDDLLRQLGICGCSADATAVRAIELMNGASARAKAAEARAESAETALTDAENRHSRQLADRDEEIVEAGRQIAKLHDERERAEAAFTRVREAHEIHRVAHPSPVGGCAACHMGAALGQFAFGSKRAEEGHHV